MSWAKQKRSEAVARTKRLVIGTPPHQKKRQSDCIDLTEVSIWSTRNSFCEREGEASRKLVFKLGTEKNVVLTAVLTAVHGRATKSR